MRRRKRLTLLLLLLRLRRKKYYCKRKFWVRPIFKIRQKLGEFNNLVQELRTMDREYFFRYFRMNPERFDHLLSLVHDRIAKKDTTFRKSISAEERLALTLKFLATGDAQQSISYSYRMLK